MERREKNRERNMGLFPALHKHSLLGAMGLGEEGWAEQCMGGSPAPSQPPTASSQLPTHLSGPSCPTWCLPKSLMVSAWISM